MIKELIHKKLDREISKPKIGIYHPSSICSPCLLSIWLDFKYPKKQGLETIGIFEAGNAVHNFVQKIVRDSKFESLEEFEFEKTYFNGLFKIKGRADNIITINTESKKETIMF